MSTNFTKINPYGAQARVKSIGEPWSPVLANSKMIRKCHPRVRVNTWDHRFNVLVLSRKGYRVEVTRLSQAEPLFFVSHSSRGHMSMDDNKSPIEVLHIIKSVLFDSFLCSPHLDSPAKTIPL